MNKSSIGVDSEPIQKKSTHRDSNLRLWKMRPLASHIYTVHSWWFRPDTDLDPLPIFF